MGNGDSCGHISTDEMEKIANIKKWLVADSQSLFFNSSIIKTTSSQTLMP